MIGRALLVLLFLLIVTVSIIFKVGDGFKDRLSVNGALEQATVVRVVDGDTLWVEYEGQEKKVRLIGMDCPELNSGNSDAAGGYGEAAADYTRSLVHPGQTIYLQKDVSEVDVYDRLLRYVWLSMPSDPDDEDEMREYMLNARLILDGYAYAKKYAPDTKYSEIFSEFESEAMEEIGGL